MISLKRTTSSDQDFIALVKMLDKNLALSDGKDHDFYNQFNTLDAIKHTVVGYLGQTPVSCGAIKVFDATTFEIKRMFTLDQARGNGYAVIVLNHLEAWAKELGATTCLLETGLKQKAAISLYKKCGYLQIPNYGQYKGINNSFCFEKVL